MAICADPVPVRRPGVRGAALEFADWIGDAQTGKTKRGLYLQDVGYTSSQLTKTSMAYLTVSQRTSTHDAQLETMISPETGLHFSFPATSARL